MRFFRKKKRPKESFSSFYCNNISIPKSPQILENCSVIQGTRFIITQDQKLLFLANIVDNLSLIEVLKKWTICEEDYDYCKFSDDFSTISLKFFPRETKLSGTTISICHYEPNNLYHFFLDAIFDLINAYHQELKIDNIIIPPDLLPRFREVITALFPNARLVELSTNELIKAEKLAIFSEHNCQWHWLREGSSKNKKLFNGKNYLNYGYLLKLHEILAQIIKAPNSNPDDRKKIVFILRNSSFRNSINQEALVAMLKHKYSAYNLRIIDPMQISFAQMREVLADTEILLSQAGASLMNIIFSAKTPLKLITWRYVNENQDSTYQQVIEALGHEYIELPALLCQRENPGQISAALASESQSDLLAPISLIDELLKQNV